MSGVLLVLSNPVDGREDEYNEWYSNVHIPQILALPTFTRATRFALDGSGAAADPGPGAHRYLAVYDVTDTTDAARQLGELAASGGLTTSDALAAETIVQGFYERLDRGANPLG